MDATRWNMAQSARRDWERQRRASGGAPAPEEAERAILARVYAAVDLAMPPVYRFKSPLAAMLALPHIAAFHKVCTYDAYLLRDLEDPITSTLGGESGWRNRGGIFQNAFHRPIKDQVSRAFLDGFTDELGALLRKLGGDAFAASRIQSGLFNPIAPPTLAWWTSVQPSSCWWWPYPRFLVISDNSFNSKWDPQNRIHREEGAAVWFPDQCQIFAWHGVLVPEKVINSPGTITVEEIDSELNAEVRRVLIERMGAGKYLTKSGAQLVDMDSLTLDGSAPRALLRDKHGNMWLVGTDGSTARVYTMSVPSIVRTCREAHEAIAGFRESRLIAEA